MKCNEKTASVWPQCRDNMCVKLVNIMIKDGTCRWPWWTCGVSKCINCIKSAPLYRHWGSVQAVRPIGGVEVYLYSFLTTALDGGEGSASHPGRCLPPGKTRYPLYRRLGGPQGWSGQVRKISSPPGFDPVATRYTVYVIRPTINCIDLLLLGVLTAPAHLAVNPRGESTWTAAWNKTAQTNQ